MVEFKKVENMSIGQVIDALLLGERFYVHEHLVVSWENESGGHFSEHTEHAYFGFSHIKKYLDLGLLTQRVETHWTDNLDGSWENGVWCLYGDDYTKVLGSKTIPLSYGMYELCTPVPKELAELLEKNYQIEMEK